MTNTNENFFVVEAIYPNLEKAEELSNTALIIYEVDGIEEFSIDEPMVDEILGDRAYSGGDIPLVVIDEVERETKIRNEISYKYYFFNGDLARASNFYEYICNTHTDVKASIDKKEIEDWNEEWKKHYAPIQVSENMRVVPEWYKEEGYKDNKEDIYIYPGMGFGTGEHETTFLCLKLYSSIVDKFPKDSSCLDFGCGSGILGVGAIKNNDMIVDFVDIDTAALDNCLQNLELNFRESDLNGHSLILRNRFKADKQYELVYANILEHVLILEKELILESIKKDGYLILSGILNEQVPTILKEYSYLEHCQTLSKGDWSAIMLKSL